MSVYTAIAATAAAAGTDVVASESWRQASYARVLQRIGYSGGAAAGGSLISVLIGQEEVATMYSTNTGLPQADASMFNCRSIIPANSNLSVLIREAGATNPTYVTVELSRG